jgi:glutamate/aspartate transport system substrate-binding protein
MNARKLAASLLAAGIVSLVGAAPAQTLEKVAQNHRITVSYRESAVPFSYLLSPTKPVGFSVDLTERIVEEVRRELRQPALEVTYVPVTAQTRIPQLVAGAYDLECGSTTNTSARGNDVAFSTSFFYAGTRILTRTDSGVQRYEDLAGKVVATTAGSTNEKVLRQYTAGLSPSVQYLPAKDYGDAFAALREGRAAALASDDVLLYGIRANAEDPASLKIVGDALQVEPYGCMMRKGDVRFKQVVHRAIAKAIKSGEFTRMYARWFQAPIPPKGVVLDMPMSEALKANLKALSDKPAS